MNKQTILLLIALISISASLELRHNFWYTAPKAAVVKGIPFSDTAWNYCDMKCTYLEKYNPGKDFVVIPFTESTFKPDFAACYVVSTNGTSQYTLWSNVTQNAYYEKNCGGDTEDYYANSQGANAKYKVSGDILGQGIGT